MFIGRRSELASLEKLRKKETASLACILGRRRIGKSTLVNQFSQNFPRYLIFQGLGPDENAGLRDQLSHFAHQLSRQTNQRQETFNNWSEAFDSLAKSVKQGATLVLLDEISWMARGDKLFAARLKDAWDLQLKKNNKLILILCGSVSSWIQDNILNSTNFEGRVSLRIDLQDLDLPSINQFWVQRNCRMGSLEKALILSVTGGVPKYLEEVLSSESAETNLIRLCFTKSGLLYHDYEYIFSDILGRRAGSLDKIIRLCLETKMTPSDLAKKLRVPYNSDLTKALQILELSGFLSRDYTFNADGAATKINHLRVKDNYLRFYLKYIEPNKAKIEKGGKTYRSLSEIKNFDGILGLQFENLILHNRTLLYPHLQLTENQIISAAPHRQNKTTTNKGGCQIDLLIHSNLDVFYLCEMKCQKIIDRSIVTEVQKKMRTISLPRRSSLQPVLIYNGEIYKPHHQVISDYFYKMIPFESLLEGPPPPKTPT